MYMHVSKPVMNSGNDKYFWTDILHVHVGLGGDYQIHTCTGNLLVPQKSV